MPPSPPPPACSYGNSEIPPGHTHTHTHPLPTPTRGGGRRGGGPAGPGHGALGTAASPRRAARFPWRQAAAAPVRLPPGHRPLARRLLLPPHPVPLPAAARPGSRGGRLPGCASPSEKGLRSVGAEEEHPSRPAAGIPPAAGPRPSAPAAGTAGPEQAVSQPPPAVKRAGS